MVVRCSACHQKRPLTAYSISQDDGRCAACVNNHRPASPYTKRDYPLEVESLTGNGGEPVGWFTKGHHTPEAVASAAFCAEMSEFGLDENDAARLDPATIRQTWWRTVPSTRCTHEDWDYVFKEAEPGSRGAFPVTVGRYDWGVL